MVVQKSYIRVVIGRAVVFFYEGKDRHELRVGWGGARIEGMLYS